MTQKTILQRVKELAPWHFNIELDYGIRTGDCSEPDAADANKRNVATIKPEEMRSFFDKYYHQGLAGKDVLDVACNAGGYCFLAHELVHVTLRVLTSGNIGLTRQPSLSQSNILTLRL